MPSKYRDYYAAVADRMMPLLPGRKIAVEQRFPGSKSITYRRHAGPKDDDTWLRVDTTDQLLDWVRQYAEGFHAHLQPDGDGAWFAIDIDARDLPLDMARLGAVHAMDLLTRAGLTPLAKFSGSNGFHLMWSVPDIGNMDSDEFWHLERAVVRAVACEVERELAQDSQAQAIRDAVGEGKPLVATGSADRDNSRALLFDQFILKENANIRVPFSIHPGSGLVAVPLTRDALTTFEPEMADPMHVAADWPALPLPSHSLQGVQTALKRWHEDGCD
jgi:hypothetical protein